MLPPDFARAYLLHAAHLDTSPTAGAAAIPDLVTRLGCIQIDPIDRVGTNADLVAFARIDGIGRGDVYRASAGRAFEHFAKERCLIDARFFPYYRDQAIETPWWRHSERMKKVPKAALDAVLAEVAERGPVTADQLTDHGRTEAMDWSGWKSTSKVTVLALEVLWTKCAVVVSGRDARGRHVYDTPARALGSWAHAPAVGSFTEELLVERVRTAGLLSRRGGPHWSMLKDARTDGTVERLIEAGRLIEVRVGKRPYLALPALQRFVPQPITGPLRILGPLDPLIWDRDLIRAVFDFDYVWEVYKPAVQRAWGYYVCPLLDGAQLVGRIEAVRAQDTLRVLQLWGQPDPERLEEALKRLAAQNNCKKVAIDASR